MLSKNFVQILDQEQERQDTRYMDIMHILQLSDYHFMQTKNCQMIDHMLVETTHVPHYFIPIQYKIQLNFYIVK